MSSVTTAAVVGAASSKAWSQVHSYTPSLEKLDTHGSLLLVLSIKTSASNEDKTITSIGKEIIANFQEEYYASSIKESNTYELLAKILEKISESYVTYTLGAVAGTVVFREEEKRECKIQLAAIGSASGFLLRGDRIYRLLPESALNEKGVESTSGDVSHGDMILLATSDFLKTVSAGKIKQALVSGDPADASSILAPLISGSGLW